MTMTLDELRRRFRTALAERGPVQHDRLTWDRERIAAFQRRRLRRLLAHAIEHAPFHARRLAGVDPDTFALDQLPSLPVMTKADMMAAFDDVVTDRRLTRERVQAHHAATGPDPSMLEGAYFALTSGGSSGLKGMFVYDWGGLVEYATVLTGREGPPTPGRAALVVSPSAAHPSRLLGSLLEGGIFELLHVPVTLPLQEIVRQLNHSQPDVLYGYSSILHRLAIEQLAGRLSIRPARIRVSAEQLLPEAETHITAAFGVPIFNAFASSEGVFGVKRPGEEAFTFATDLAILELVDEHHRPVPTGAPSAAVLVTNLFNTVQPLIRYVLEDRFVRRPDAAGHGHLVATVEGRSSETFEYPDAHVHPRAVLAALIESPAVADYQICQTPDGIEADVLVNRQFDRAVLEAEITQALAEAGLPDPQVSIRIVDRLNRDAHTGKLRRLVPLGAYGRVSAPTDLR